MAILIRFTNVLRGHLGLFLLLILSSIPVSTSAENYVAEPFTVGGKDVRVLYASQSGQYIVARVTSEPPSDFKYVLLDRVSGVVLQREIAQGSRLLGVDNLGGVYVRDTPPLSFCSAAPSSANLKRVSLLNEATSIFTETEKLAVDSIFITAERLFVIAKGGEYKQTGGRGSFCKFNPSGTASVFVGMLTDSSVSLLSDAIDSASVSVGEVVPGEALILAAPREGKSPGGWYSVSRDNALRSLGWSAAGLTFILGSYDGALLVLQSPKYADRTPVLVSPLSGARSEITKPKGIIASFNSARDSIVSGYQTAKYLDRSVFDNGSSRYFLTPTGVRTDLSCLLPSGFRSGWIFDPLLLPNGEILLSGIKDIDPQLQHAVEATALLRPSVSDGFNRCLSGSVRIHGCGTSFDRQGSSFSAEKPVSKVARCNATLKLSFSDGRPAAGLPIKTQGGAIDLGAPNLSDQVTDANGTARVAFPTRILCKKLPIFTTIGRSVSESLEYDLSIVSNKGCR